MDRTQIMQQSPQRHAAASVRAERESARRESFACIEWVGWLINAGSHPPIPTPSMGLHRAKL